MSDISLTEQEIAIEKKSSPERSEIRFRPITKEDISLVQGIAQQCYPKTINIHQEYFTSLLDLQEATGDNPEKGSFLVLKDSIPLGYILMIPRMSSVMGNVALHISDIVILSEYRNEHVFREMVQRAAKTAINQKQSIEIEARMITSYATPEENSNLTAVLEENGFRLTHDTLRPGYLAETGEEFHFMRFQNTKEESTLPTEVEKKYPILRLIRDHPNVYRVEFEELPNGLISIVSYSNEMCVSSLLKPKYTDDDYTLSKVHPIADFRSEEEKQEVEKRDKQFLIPVSIRISNPSRPERYVDVAEEMKSLGFPLEISTYMSKDMERITERISLLSNLEIKILCIKFLYVRWANGTGTVSIPVDSFELDTLGHELRHYKDKEEILKSIEKEKEAIKGKRYASLKAFPEKSREESERGATAEGLWYARKISRLIGIKIDSARKYHELGLITYQDRYKKETYLKGDPSSRQTLQQAWNTYNSIKQELGIN